MADVDDPAPAVPDIRRQAWVVVMIITALALLLMLMLAFSTSNTAQSVDGRSATTALNVDP